MTGQTPNGSRRVSVRAVLRDPRLRKELMVGVIVATQAREGIHTTTEQAAAAYDKVQRELALRSARDQNRTHLTKKKAPK